MSPEELKARARRVVEEILNQGDLAVANELISPDCVHHVPGGQPAPGLAGLIGWLALTQRIFPDFHAIVEDEIAEGDRVVQRITCYGTHQGEFSRRPADRRAGRLLQHRDQPGRERTGSSPSTGPRPTCSASCTVSASR